MMLNTINGSTRLIPILGDPIAQVKAPQGLTTEFARRGRNTLVLPFHVAPSNFNETVSSLAHVQNVDGFIATVPHKFAAREQCATLSPRAEFLGVANVVRRSSDRSWHGDMLDGLGFVRGIEVAGCHVPDRRALLVGAGGAGSAIALALLERGVAALAVHDIDPAKREALIAKLASVHPGKVFQGAASPVNFDLVVNATPLGMRADDPMPIDTEGLDQHTFVGDVITVPEITPLLQVAQAKGCRTQTGVGMFENSIALMADFFLTP
jgi:shikimate 5-dehydrogenase